MAKRSKSKKAPNTEKPEFMSFGEAVRWAIKQEFGQQNLFAKVAGFSPSSINQHLKPDSMPTPATLEKILTGFKSEFLREVIRDAYSRFGIENTPVVISGSLDMITEIRKLAAHGYPRRALKLAAQVKKLGPTPEIQQQAAEEEVQLHLRLVQPHKAMRLLQQMEDRGRALNRPKDVLTAMWMRITTLRTLDGVTNKQLEPHLQLAIAFLSTFSPDTAEDRAWYKNRHTALTRSHALSLVTGFELDGKDEECLKVALEYVNDSIQEGEDMGDQPIINAGKEVKIRILIAGRNGWDAEELIEELDNPTLSMGTDMVEKLNMDRAKYAVLTNRHEQAIDYFERVHQDCLRLENYHHARVASKLAASTALRR